MDDYNKATIAFPCSIIVDKLSSPLLSLVNLDSSELGGKALIFHCHFAGFTGTDWYFIVILIRHHRQDENGIEI